MEERPESFVRHGTEEQRIEVSADDVLNAIAEGRDVDVEYAVVVGDVDIRNVADQFERGKDGIAVVRMIFEGPVIKGDIVIKHSEFRGYIYFDLVILSGNVRFTEVTFNRDTQFTQVRFNEGASFHYNTFSEHAFFTDSLFVKDVGFVSADFNKGASFERAIFHGRASFDRANFSEVTSFGYVTFSNKAYFNDVSFGDNADFGYSSFGGDASFRSATFIGRTHFNYAEFSKLAEFGLATFEGKLSFDSVTFGARLAFADAILEYPANFAEVIFHKNTVIAGLWNHIFRPLLQPIVWFITVGKLRDLAEIPVTDFSGLNTNVIMDESSNLDLKRYIEDEQRLASLRRNNKPLFILSEVTSHGGRSPWLLAWWSILWLLLFSLIYWMLGCDNIAFDVGRLEMAQPDFLDYLYYSVVTFTTLGFGDIVPLTKWGRLAVGAEVVVGYLTLGMLISLIANKLWSRG